MFRHSWVLVPSHAYVTTKALLVRHFPSPTFSEYAPESEEPPPEGGGAGRVVLGVDGVEPPPEEPEPAPPFAADSPPPPGGLVAGWDAAS